MKIILVQEASDRMADALIIIKRLKDLKPANLCDATPPALYFITPSKHAWELRFQLAVRQIIEKPVTAEQLWQLANE